MNEFSFRKANKNDFELTLGWANDEETRKNSFNMNPISIEEHAKWFNTKLKSNDSRMYIFLKDTNPVGVVRLDLKDDIALISYSIDRQYRGLGYGKHIMRELEQVIQSDSTLPKNLKANVKYDNLASQKIFEKLNYNSTKKNDYIEYNKTVGIK